MEQPITQPESKQNRYIKLAIACVAVIVLALVVLLWPRSGMQPLTQTPSNGQSTGTAPTGTPSGSKTVTGGSAPAAPKSPAPKPTPTPSTSAYHFTTPVAGESWKLQTSNLISWNRSGNVSGQLYLVDANTKTFVGTILSQVGPQQTYYDWNTRDLFVSRNSPTKFPVAPGTYMIVLTYDGNNIPMTTSPVFTIVQ